MTATSFLLSNRQPIRQKNAPADGTIAASSKSVFRLPVGPTYERVILYCEVTGAAATQAQWLAGVDEIKVLVDSDMKMRLSGRELLYLDLLNQAGQNATPASPSNGFVTLHFSHELFARLQSRVESAYGLSANSSFQIEIEWAAGSAIDACDLYRETTVGVPLGTHRTLRRIVKAISVTGDNQITDIPRDPSTRLLALHLSRVGGAAHTITDIELVADGTRLIDLPTNAILKSDRDVGRNNGNDSAILSLDFVRRGRFGESLEMIMQSLELNVTTSSSGWNLNIIQELAEVQGPRS